MTQVVGGGGEGRGEQGKNCTIPRHTSLPKCEKWNKEKERKRCFIIINDYERDERRGEGGGGYVCACVQILQIPKGGEEGRCGEGGGEGRSLQPQAGGEGKGECMHAWKQTVHLHQNPVAVKGQCAGVACEEEEGGKRGGRVR